MNRAHFLLSICALALVAGLGQAYAKPNFTGDWKLNVAKSEFGPMPAPDKMTMKIDHKEPEINVKQVQSGAQGDQEFDAKYMTDGQETTNKLGPMDTKTVAKWDGETLVLKTVVNVGGTDITLDGKWVLTDEGKTLTYSAHLVTPQGEIDLKYVLEKQ